jgi:hypothetical protein
LTLRAGNQQDAFLLTFSIGFKLFDAIDLDLFLFYSITPKKWLLKEQGRAIIRIRAIPRIAPAVRQNLDQVTISEKH